MSVSAIALFWLASGTQALIPYTDADDFGQAVGLVAAEIRTIEESRLYCASEVESARAYFDHFALLWETQNDAEILAVETYLDRDSDRARFESLRDVAVAASMAAFRAVAAVAGPDKLCAATFQAIQSGDRNVAKQTPKASQFLRAYLQDNPPATEAVGKRNDFMGCKIQLTNKKVDLDSAKRTCTCAVDVIHRGASPEELAEMDRVARARGDVAHLPVMARLAPDLAACASAR